MTTFPATAARPIGLGGQVASAAHCHQPARQAHGPDGRPSLAYRARLRGGAPGPVAAHHQGHRLDVRRRLFGRGWGGREGFQARPGGAVAAQPGQRKLPGPAMGLAGDQRGHGTDPVGERRGDSVRRARVQHPARGVLCLRGAGPGNSRGRRRDLCPAGGPAGGVGALSRPARPGVPGGRQNRLRRPTGCVELRQAAAAGRPGPGAVPSSGLRHRSADQAGGLLVPRRGLGAVGGGPCLAGYQAGAGRGGGSTEHGAEA